MPDNPSSHIVRVAYSGKRESETVVLNSDEISVRRDPEGFLVVELFRYGANNRALEGYQFRFCPEDAERVKQG